MAGRQDDYSVFSSAMSNRKEAFANANTVVTAYLDKSASLGDQTLPEPPQLTLEEQEKLWSKLDMRLLPILSLMYLMSYMDRCAVVLPSLQLYLLTFPLSFSQYRFVRFSNIYIRHSQTWQQMRDWMDLKLHLE
jgi:hypothetical protein